MIRLEFSPVEALPDAILQNRGPVSKALVKRGIGTFHLAAEYVHQLPYGLNGAERDSLIVIRDGFGTCRTKHGLIARLAGELSLAVRRCEGFYRLTDAVVTGVGDILKDRGLPYILRTHCFLTSRGRYVDLTEGNCTGKNVQVREYEKVVEVPPEQHPEEVIRCYKDCFSELCVKDDTFARVGVEGLLEVLRQCEELNASLCRATSPFLPKG